MENLLEIAIVICMLMSGWNACRYHMDEKSPSVQPTKHRSVFRAERRHIDREAQKLSVVRDDVFFLVCFGHGDFGSRWLDACFKSTRGRMLSLECIVGTWTPNDNGSNRRCGVWRHADLNKAVRKGADMIVNQE